MEKKVKENNNIFKKIVTVLKYYDGSKIYPIGYLFVSLVEAAFGVLFPILTAKIILAITDGTMNLLIRLAIFVTCMRIIRSAIGYAKSILYRKINFNTLKNIGLKLSEETLKVTTAEIDKNTSGLFIERLNKDAGDLGQVFMELTYWTTNVLGKIGIVVSIFILNKVMFAYSLITAFIIFLINRFAYNIKYKRNKVIRLLNEEKTGLVSETIRGSRDIKVLNADKSILVRITERINDILDRRDKVQKDTTIAYTLRDVYSHLSDFGYLMICVYLYNKGNITIPVFITLYHYRGNVKELFAGVSNILSYIKDFQLSYERVFEVIGDKFEKEKFGKLEVPVLKGNIKFKDVKFSYGDKNVIDGMNFTIKPNQKVAFVGKSGAGKSTIFSLLTKLYDIQSGDILLDGNNIKKLSKDSIRNNMSLITQDPYIFNFSIKENFIAIKEDATMDEIREVCKLARIDDFIMTLPDQYETKIGENGVIFSGGQKQRLAIARALLLKTEIILFDEATSALDNETQQEITEAINNMHGEYTILIVAHRLSTIVNCDKIFVVDDGKIIAEGSHKQLMKKCKFYQDLYQQEL